MSKRASPLDQIRIELAGWLSDFPVATRAKGRDYYSRGRVIALQWGDGTQEPMIAAAVVQGSQDYECTLRRHAGEGWTGECTCPVGDECTHLYAVGSALLAALSKYDFSEADAPAPQPPAAQPEETALIEQFTVANGAAPNRKELAWLRNLLRLFYNVHSGSPYFDVQALTSLLPATHRFGAFSYYESPFHDRWTHPPSGPLEFWSHLAVVFEERNLPQPAFMARLTDLAWARAAVAAYRREKEVAHWRTRFAALANSVASAPDPDASAPALRQLRLRLAVKKPVWEVSAPDSAPDGQSRFVSISNNELRDYLLAASEPAFELATESIALASLARTRLSRENRLAVKLGDANDRAFLGRIFTHPHARACVVADTGESFVRDPRRLVWQVRDHPEDPELTLAQLAFADGTPAPVPLLHLPGRPDLYVHGHTVFTGLPPPATDLARPAPIPRAALALPEAGQFAVRAGVTLPGDIADRVRRETLRARLRARIDRRRPGPTAPVDDLLVVELTALAPDGTPRAHLDEGSWRRKGPGLAPPADAAFLVLDFEPTRAAAEQFLRLPPFRDAWHPEGPRFTAEISSPGFPEAFSNWLAGFPPDTIIELAPELAAFTQAPTRAHFELDLTPGDEAGIDWFDVRVTLRAEDTTLTAEEIALLHAARGRFVRLAGRGWRRLALDDSPAAQEKLARLGLDAAAVTSASGEPLRFHALQLADESLKDTLPEKLWSQVRARSAALRACPPPETPTGLVADLRPYQQQGFHFLAFLAENRFGGVLADDMGLGKTLQALAWLLWLADRGTVTGKPFRVLVVCPKSVVVNWQLETARFAPALTTTVFTPALVAPAGNSEPGTAGSGSGLPTLDSHLLVANYTQLRLHAEAFASVTWDAVILDEGQNIKNPASATAQAARALRSAHRLVLTGTPIENRLLDLWSLFAFAQPGLLGGQTAFKRLHNDKNDPAGARSRLAMRVKHFLLRRTKSQVARDLPPRIEDELVVDLEGEQRRLYDAELKRARALLLGVKSARDFDTQRFNILQSLLRLRQICCDPRLLGVGESKPSDHRKAGKSKTGTKVPDMPSSLPPPSAKLEALLDTLEPLIAEGHKVLVFSQFVTMLELIRVELTARGIAHLMLTGQTEKRQELVDRFQADPAIPVFLLSLKAAGSGLNLTAASYVVLFDPWWNPAVEAQAIDRTHRIGQKNQVIAYRLLARGTVEEKIRALQKEKAALAAAVVQEESLASVLDLDSLRRILA